jgi:hypothetical protein
MIAKVLSVAAVLAFIGVIARFLGLDLRGAMRFFGKGLLVGVAALGAVVAALVLQNYLDAHPGYLALVSGAARVGPWVVALGAAVLVVDLAVLVVLTIRHGKPDGRAGTVVPDGPLPLKLGFTTGRSKRKILGGKEAFVTMDSLVSGSATSADRILAAGVGVLFLSFWSIFVGVGLIVARQLLIVGVLLAAVPGLWVYGSLIRPVWAAYRTATAKERSAHSHQAGR